MPGWTDETVDCAVRWNRVNRHFNVIDLAGGNLWIRHRLECGFNPSAFWIRPIRYIIRIINWVVRALNANWLTAVVYQTVSHRYDKTFIFTALIMLVTSL